MDAMKITMAAAALLAATALAGPALGQAASIGGVNDMGSKGAVNVQDTNIKPYQAQTNTEGEAEEMRLKGQCDKAVPILRAFAALEGDRSIARYNLGMCLFDLAAKQHDAAQVASMRKEGAGWILQAADGGSARAQAEAVVICLDGVGVAADPVEAAKWSILYRHNGTRLAIGLRDIAPEVSDRLDAALTDASRRQAQARADDWTHAAQSSSDE